MTELIIAVIYGFCLGWWFSRLYHRAKVERFRVAIQYLTKKDWQILADIWLDQCEEVFRRGSRFISSIDASYVAGLNEGIRMERRNAAGTEKNNKLLAAIEKLKP